MYHTRGCLEREQSNLDILFLPAALFGCVPLLLFLLISPLLFYLLFIYFSSFRLFISFLSFLPLPFPPPLLRFPPFTSCPTSSFTLHCPPLPFLSRYHTHHQSVVDLPHQLVLCSCGNAGQLCLFRESRC